MSKDITVDKLKRLSECEAHVFDALVDRNLILLFTRRMITTLEFKPEELGFSLEQSGTSHKDVPASSRMESKDSASSSSTSAAKPNSLPVREEKKTEEPIVVQRQTLDTVFAIFDGLATQLRRRLEAYKPAKGSERTLKTKLRDKAKELGSVLDIAFKQSSSKNISEELLAQFNNSLLAFLQSCHRTLMHDSLLTQPATILLSRLQGVPQKVKKLWSLARALDPGSWNRDEISGNITKKLEDSAEADAGDGTEW